MLNMNLGSNINSIPYLEYMQKQEEKLNVKQKQLQEIKKTTTKSKTKIKL